MLNAECLRLKAERLTLKTGKGSSLFQHTFWGKKNILYAGIWLNSDFAGPGKIVFLQPFPGNREGDSPLAQLVRASDC
jgi:hypothetical protein